MSNQPKTTDQLRAIFGLGKEKGLDKADLEALADEISEGRVVDPATNSPRLSLLTFDDANAVITHLGGDAFPADGSVPKRTQNYRKQKAGIDTIESAKQLKLIRDLAAKRNMGEDGLTKLAGRMRLPWPPQTTKQGNKIAEALKDMNARDAKKKRAA